MGRFTDSINNLQECLKRIDSNPSYRIETLTEGKIKDILAQTTPVAGVYVMYDNDVPTYVGRSSNLAQKIGTDERALGKIQATVSRNIVKTSNGRFNTISEARQYLFNNYSVKFITVDDEILRAMLVIYLSTELNTKFNNFMET